MNKTKLQRAIRKAIPRWVHEPDGDQTNVPYVVLVAAARLASPDYRAGAEALFEHEANPGHKLEDQHPRTQHQYMLRAKAVLDSQLEDE